MIHKKLLPGDTIFFESCTAVVTYCGDATSGDVHTPTCEECGNPMGGTAENCTFELHPLRPGKKCQLRRPFESGRYCRISDTKPPAGWWQEVFAPYSVLRATTGSLLAALREGIKPAIKVRNTEIHTKIAAATGER